MSYESMGKDDIIKSLRWRVDELEEELEAQRKSWDIMYKTLNSINDVDVSKINDNEELKKVFADILGINMLKEWLYMDDEDKKNICLLSFDDITGGGDTCSVFKEKGDCACHDMLYNEDAAVQLPLETCPLFIFPVIVVEQKVEEYIRRKEDSLKEFLV